MTLLFLLALLSPRATVAPSRPNIGDVVTIRFDAPPTARITLAPSPTYSLVRTQGNEVTVQIFRTGDVALSGEVWSGDERVRFTNLLVKVQPVLRAVDDLKPAAPAPPRDLPRDVRSWWITGAALALAAVPWIVLYLPAKTARRTRRRKANLLDELAEIERMEPRQAWSRLAELTRELLSERSSSYPLALTTTELVERFRGEEPSSRDTVEMILSEGDYAKFSPFVSSPAHLRDALAGLRSLASPPPEAGAPR